MKKNKNEAVKTSPRKEEAKDTVKENILPEKADDGKEYPFKKVLYGYSPEEVISFIDEISRTHEASSKLHEDKLSSLKEELVLSNRERDYYSKKCKTLQSEGNRESAPPSDEADELKTIISQLKEKIGALENENRNLKDKSDAKTDNIMDTYLKKISDLELRNTELSESLAAIQKENSHLLQQAEKYEALADEHKAVLMKYEETKLQLASKEKELDSKRDMLLENSEKINALTGEKEELKIKLSELEIQNNVLTQRVAESEKENAELTEKNKFIVIENAEKLNAIESEFAQSKLTAQKELKLYGYYVERAEITLAELTKQMEEIRQSIEKSEI